MTPFPAHFQVITDLCWPEEVQTVLKFFSFTFVGAIILAPCGWNNKEPLISLLPNSSHSSYGANNSIVGLLMWIHIGKPFDSIRLAAQEQGNWVGNHTHQLHWNINKRGQPDSGVLEKQAWQAFIAAELTYYQHNGVKKKN
jgi:hypothetical protein